MSLARNGSESGAVALAFVDFLLLSLVTILVIRSRAVDLHVVDFEPPAVTGDGVDTVREPIEFVLDVGPEGGLSVEGRAVELAEVRREIERAALRVLVRSASAVRADRLVDLVSQLRAVADSVQLMVTPATSGR